MNNFMNKAIAAFCILTLTATPVMAGEIGPGMGLDETTAPSVTEQPVGPGYVDQPEQPAPEQPVQGDDSTNYYLQNLSDPVVKAVDKYSYDQMIQDMQTLQQRYGSHMTMSSIGRTLDNRELHTVIVGNPNASKQILVAGGIHGREHITSLLMMKQLEYVLTFYDSGAYNGQSLSSMLDKVAIHFVPMTNPDGISISQWGEGGIGSPELKQAVQNIYQSDVVLGKTHLSYNGYLRLWKANAGGVDLNYNFDARWHTTERQAKQPSYSGYKGTSPLSELETSALATHIQNHPFKAIVNYHAMGQIIYWDAPDNQKREASLNLAQIIAQASGYRVDNTLGVLGLKDWVQSKDSPIPSITIEVGRVSCPIPVSEFDLIWNQNRSVIARSMEYVINNN